MSGTEDGAEQFGVQRQRVRRVVTNLRPVLDAWDWQREAACRGLDVDVFYPSDRYAKSMAERAKRICANCPVILDCLGHALKTGESHGIWGATTPFERQDWLQPPRASKPTTS